MGLALAAFFVPRLATVLAMEVTPVVGFKGESDRRLPAVDALFVGQDRKEQSAYDGHGIAETLHPAIQDTVTAR